MKGKVYYSVMIFFGLWACASVAQTIPEAKMEEIVVTASKVERSLEEIPARVEVVKEDMIREIPHLKVDDLLNKVSGINVVRNNSIYTMTATAVSYSGTSSMRRTPLRLTDLRVL